eukprot:386618-Pelagomonas_calceolata.AAC.1
MSKNHKDDYNKKALSGHLRGTYNQQHYRMTLTQCQSPQPTETVFALRQSLCSSQGSSPSPSSCIINHV